MKLLKVVVLTVTIGLAVLAQSTPATAQPVSSTFDEAEGPDEVCELTLIAGGPYDVTIDGGAVTVYENGSVVEVPQGSSVNYLRSERTFGFTATGVTERCAVFGAETGSAEGQSADETPGESTASAEQPAELAVTGTETSLLAIGGVVLVVAGFQLLLFRRRL